MTTATKSRGRKRQGGAGSAAEGKTPRQRVEEEIADRIIELLDRGELPPWEKDWRSSAFGLPMNAVSMNPYRGINRWMTMMTQQLMGYNDPRWVTYRQAQALGGHVRKGEESTTVVFWKRVRARRTARDTGDEDGTAVIDQERDQEQGREDGPRTYPMLRAYHVFNIEQTEDCRLGDLPEDERTGHDPIEAAAAIIRGMPGAPPIEHYSQANHAPCYIPSRDVVRVPDLERYNSPEGYYNTVFHELVHSTGHPDRLHRFETAASAGNLHAYGREELVAGMGSAMLAAHAGIAGAVIERDASYIRHWRDAISADKAMVIRAATLAQRASDFILDVPAPDFTPEKPSEEKPSEEKPSEERPSVEAGDAADPAAFPAAA